MNLLSSMTLPGPGFMESMTLSMRNLCILNLLKSMSLRMRSDSISVSGC